MKKKTYVRKYKSHHYTDDEIKSIVNNWAPGQGTLDDIANLVGLRREQVSYVAASLRKQGLDLPRMRSKKGSNKYLNFVNKYKK